VIFLVDRIRISIGTAIHLGLENGRLDKNFSTAFLMTFLDGKCSANCVFCPQARDSSSASDRLSRISWPDYPFENIIQLLSNQSGFSRACIQSLNYANVVDDVEDILNHLQNALSIPISVCIHPISSIEMKRLKEAGVTNIGIAMDACTSELFEKIKGSKRGAPYHWKSHLKALEHAQRIFGKNHVTTHLIIGLGETEAEAADFIFKMYDLGITVGLFAFTPISGTAYEDKRRPNMGVYRRIQILRYLIHHKRITENEIDIDKSGKLIFKLDITKLKETLSSGAAFQTSGCPGCNRPYYNESPRGPFYNYPHPLTGEDVSKAIEESGL
jgi:biotin synthase